MKGTSVPQAWCATGMLFSLPRLRSSSAKSGFVALDRRQRLVDRGRRLDMARAEFEQDHLGAMAMIRLSSTISAVPDRRGGAGFSVSTLVATA